MRFISLPYIGSLDMYFPSHSVFTVACNLWCGVTKAQFTFCRVFQNTPQKLHLDMLITNLYHKNKTNKQKNHGVLRRSISYKHLIKQN